MSKKAGGTPKNTLFKYFSKSPVVSKSPSVTTIKPCVINEIDEKETTKRPYDEENSDDDLVINKKKRRRVFSLQSDSDCENDQINGDKNNFNEKTSASKSSKDLKQKLQTLQQESISILPDIDKKILDDHIVWKHNNFDFLKPEKIKDKNGHRPEDPNYNHSTLFVSDSFLNTLTPGMRQWWEFKSQYFDCVLFFKVGKFYELYHMDADIAVQELGCNYMRGEFAHSGFPEISYDKMASKLVDKGYKVARVEQTETPNMMNERCKKQFKVTKFDKVVKREICQITNRGTRVFGIQNQVTLKHTANYMLSIVEKNVENKSIYGICFVDTSIGDFYFGQFEDDKNCSRFLTLLSHYPPVLVLFLKNAISNRTEQIFRTILSGVLKENLKEFQFLDAEKTLKDLLAQYPKMERQQLPQDLRLVQDETDHLGLLPNDNFQLALKAIGQCIVYLKKCFLDQQVLSTCHYKLYIPPDINYKSKIMISPTEIAHNISEKSQLKNQHMVLDSVTLANLRITESDYSLLSCLDFCCTTFGKRLLRHWICSPSCNVDEIRNRQQAISELVNNQDALQQIRSLFSMLPDFERYLAQIHVFGNANRLKNHPDGRAIFFEDKIYNKKKIQNFIKIIHGFESLITIPNLCQKLDNCIIKDLTQLNPDGSFPDFSQNIIFFKQAFDHEEALEHGIIAPKSGVDMEFDAIENSIENLKKELKIYLEQQEKIFNCRLNYFGNDKKRYQLEVPENKAHKAGAEYILEGQKKGNNPVRRFHTPETKDFLKRMMLLEEKRNHVLGDLSRRIYEKFSNHYEIWKKCTDSVAILDVLASLAEYSKNQTQICIPEVQESENSTFIEIEEGYHPCVLSENYIPNGISIGGYSKAPLILLTGPNMGGKSTLMRQIGLLVIMAQIGSHIPAKSCKLSVIDRIFTRLGAQDDILAGHSTFMVELNETAAILSHASPQSLVLLDELGRGTATYDGTAIAAAVVNHLSNLNCLTVFSTHYHNLVDYFHKDPRIHLGHMACIVEKDEGNDPTEETVTFLYKYISGASPKSYGFNAAKLAGMPQPVIKRAYKLSKIVEAGTLRRKIISKILCDSELNQIKNMLSLLKCCKI